MANIKDLMQEIVNLDYDELVKVGKETLGQIIGALKGIELETKQISDFILNLIRLFVSADGKCSLEECKLIQDITEVNLSMEELEEIAKGGTDEKFVVSIDKIIDLLPDDLKITISLFGLCILSADETLTPEEQKLFARILRQ